VKGPTPRRLQKYVTRCLGLRAYLQSPGDGRVQPQIPASALLWGLLIGQVLRDYAFHAIEALVACAARALGVSRAFGDDALSYFTERLDPAPTRRALADCVRRAKRNKAFDDRRFIGLSVDGTTVGRCRASKCPLCRPWRGRARSIRGYHHALALISVVGTGLILPLDVEPYGPRDSEYTAGQRLLRRTVRQVGPRFADYVVADAEYARAGFLHLAGDLGLRVVARLKANLPELFAAAQRRFRRQVPTAVFREGGDHVEVWDADDFDPWETLRWETVRVFFYRQRKPDGKVVQAYWLTDFPSRQVSSRTLFRLAKARWEIENEGFNDAKNRYGLEHICHHEAHSLLITWLLVALALTIERLYRLRYLHRGLHHPREAVALVRLLWLSLSSPRAIDSS
jgi:hypothetical protein